MYAALAGAHWKLLCGEMTEPEAADITHSLITRSQSLTPHIAPALQWSQSPLAPHITPALVNPL